MLSVIQEILRERISAIERETSVRVIEQTRKLGVVKEVEREGDQKLDCRR